MIINLFYFILFLTLIFLFEKYGPGIMFVTLNSSWFGDGMAYFFGKKYGQNKLVPYIRLIE